MHWYKNILTKFSGDVALDIFQGIEFVDGIPKAKMFIGMLRLARWLDQNEIEEKLNGIIKMIRRGGHDAWMSIKLERDVKQYGAAIKALREFND